MFVQKHSQASKQAIAFCTCYLYIHNINPGDVQRCRNESTCWYNHTHLHHPTTLPLSMQANAGCWLNVCLLHSRASLQANVHTAGCMYLIPPKTKQLLTHPAHVELTASVSCTGQERVCLGPIFPSLPALPISVLWDWEQTVLRDWNTITKGR